MLLRRLPMKLVLGGVTAIVAAVEACAWSGRRGEEMRPER